MWGLNIAKGRVNNRVEQAGLGLLDLNEMDTAMKVAWINRWVKEGEKVDIIGATVLGTGEGVLDRISPRLLNKKETPAGIA